MLVNSGEIATGGGVSPRTAAQPAISPVYFKRSVSDVAVATINFGAMVNMPRPKGQAARLGLRFEKAVLEKLQLSFNDRLATGVPISFQEGTSLGGYLQRPSTAIPDGLLLSASRDALCIIEIKLRHSTDAWFQLNRFYLPILRRAVGSSLLLRTLEICRYYDPGVKLPQAKRLVLGVEEAFRAPPECHSVLIWEKSA